MGRRERRRKREKGAAGATRAVSTSDYDLGDGGVLTLRDSLSEGTLGQLARLDAKPVASAEDRWHRRVELVFERLAVRWEIAGLPLEGQKELLGRFRMASADERRAVHRALARHLRERHADVEL